MLSASDNAASGVELFPTLHELASGLHGVRGSLVLAGLACCIHLAVHDARGTSYLLAIALGACLIAPSTHVFTSLVTLTYGYLARAIMWLPVAHHRRRIVATSTLASACVLLLADLLLGQASYGSVLAALSLSLCWWAACTWIADKLFSRGYESTGA